MHQPLKIIFMGTPEFSVPSLDAIASSPHKILTVVTAPDKPRGRGRKLKPSAVKARALELGLPILQPEKLKDPGFIAAIEALKPDVIVVVAFRILPPALFELPALGSFNLHASLLPAYRGAAPIHWALMNGDRETGVTTFFLKRSVDTGNIILQEKLPINDGDNLYTLYESLRQMGGELVLKTLDKLSAGEVRTTDQDDSLATPAPKVGPEDQILDFAHPAERCHGRIRAFAPKPGAYCLRDGVRLKILRSRVVAGSGTPGEIIALTDTEIIIACGENALAVSMVQPESKKAMESGAYMRGYSLEVGTKLA